MESQQLMASAILGIVLFGVFGNIISFYLFSRPHMRASSVNILLCALASVDLSLLLLSIPVFVIPGLNLWKDEKTQNMYHAYMLKSVYPVNLIMQTCSIYIMVLITIERWTAVCRPLQVRAWCTPTKSRLALLVVLFSAIAYNFVRFFEYSIIRTPEGDIIFERNLRDTELYPNYMIGYFTASYLITHFLIPFSIMMIMNGHVCWTIVILRRARLALTQQMDNDTLADNVHYQVGMWKLQTVQSVIGTWQQREHNTTFMLMLVTAIFACCNTLPFLLNLVECAIPDFFTNPQTSYFAYYLNDISNLLVVLNSATTFLIYYAFSAKYRSSFNDLFRLVTS
ncbi:hypothetical protein AB6A40_007437 [Gnathostoma spinigerum]|uniref:G-protein coupled receptors family 1 profile domain-containing protein n=1 Tax=Gnathostoma spinigerum TaxID=75299 RepID=A0ABD6EUK8_9BILA